MAAREASKTAQINKWRTWKKRHPDYPLTVKSNGAGGGSWAKRILGRTYYFGPVDDPDAALVRWLREKDYLLAGEEPPDETDELSVRNLCLLFAGQAESNVSVRRGALLTGGVSWVCE